MFEQNIKNCLTRNNCYFTGEYNISCNIVKIQRDYLVNFLFLLYIDIEILMSYLKLNF